MYFLSRKRTGVADPSKVWHNTSKESTLVHVTTVFRRSKASGPTQVVSFFYYGRRAYTLSSPSDVCRHRRFTSTSYQTHDLSRDLRSFPRLGHVDRTRSSLIFGPSSSRQLWSHMPFFQGSQNVDIRGGEFRDIRGNLNEFDHSKHTHYVDSHNITKSSTTGSFNDSSIQEEGKSFPIHLRSRFEDYSVVATAQYLGDGALLDALAVACLNSIYRFFKQPGTRKLALQLRK